MGDYFRLAADNILPEVYKIIALKGWFEASQVVNDAANLPHIRFVIIGLVLDLLGRQI